MKRKLFFVLEIMLFTFPTLAFAHSNEYGMWPGMMGWGHSMGWLMMIFMILFWGVVLAGIIALMRWLFFKGGLGAAQSPESALEILKKRYAKGEIDKDEFEEKKKVLEE